MLWPWSDGWQLILNAAEAANQPGSLASLWGFEWSNDLFGTEFSHLAPYTPAVRQMVGIENWNSNSNFDVYYYGGSWNSSYSKNLANPANPVNPVNCSWFRGG